jgi:hypothetical protein
MCQRHRAQARSYTVLHSCCEIACVANPVGAGLLAKALGPQKNYRLTKCHRGQARPYTDIHACCETACAANPVGAGLLAKRWVRENHIDGRNAIAGKRAPTPSYIHAARSHAPQIRRSRLAGEVGGSAKKIIDGRNAIAGKRAPTPSSIRAARSRAPQIRRSGLLAKAVGPQKLYRLPKRYRGQARSYTVLH